MQRIIWSKKYGHVNFTGIKNTNNMIILDFWKDIARFSETDFLIVDCITPKSPPEYLWD